MKQNSGNGHQKVVIGIDIGGTNADSALYDCTAKNVYAHAKVPTNHTDYAATFEALLLKIAEFLPDNKENVVAIHLSTTLSTNLLLEGRGAPVHLLLIGFEKKERLAAEIEKTVKLDSLSMIRGGHTSWGEEIAPFDAEAVRACAKRHQGGKFAVSGLFSPRNPAHEMRAAEILREEGARSVTCGHEIAQAKLNAVKRTVTTCLNASLQPLISEFVDDAERTAKRFGFTCPVMFLKSDSTLVSASWCRQYPIETVFSGPAASLRGAYYLLGDQKPQNMLMADIGGTSTDIGRVEAGSPVFSKEGVTIGAYRTMIPSLDIRSVALGGDSQVAVDKEGSVQIGPCRVSPVCRGGDPRKDYTPTDALNTLGKACIGNPAFSADASERIGAANGFCGSGFAALVWRKTQEELEKNLLLAENREKQYLRVYVGAPGQVFAQEARCDSVARIDPQAAGVASAVGAAVSAVELRCEAVIVHFFLDESYAAFLPHKKMQGMDAALLLSAVKHELQLFLQARAEALGAGEGSVALQEEYFYLGKKRDQNALASIKITAEFLRTREA